MIDWVVEWMKLGLLAGGISLVIAVVVVMLKK